MGKIRCKMIRLYVHLPADQTYTHRTFSLEIDSFILCLHYLWEKECRLKSSWVTEQTLLERKVNFDEGSRTWRKAPFKTSWPSFLGVPSEAAGTEPLSPLHFLLIRPHRNVTKILSKTDKCKKLGQNPSTTQLFLEKMDSYCSLGRINREVSGFWEELLVLRRQGRSSQISGTENQFLVMF